jgi:hypothetical protein
MNYKNKILLAVCLSELWLAPLSVSAATITVINTNDSCPGSLREALADANDHDTVGFDPSLNGQFITLTSTELVIDKNITIRGLGPDFLSVGSTAFLERIFHIMPGHSVMIEGLTIGPSNYGGGISGMRMRR